MRFVKNHYIQISGNVKMFKSDKMAETPFESDFKKLLQEVESTLKELQDTNYKAFVHLVQKILEWKKEKIENKFGLLNFPNMLRDFASEELKWNENARNRLNGIAYMFEIYSNNKEKLDVFFEILVAGALSVSTNLLTELQEKDDKSLINRIKEIFRVK